MNEDKPEAIAPNSPLQPTDKKLPPHKRFAAWHRNLSKKQKIILLVVVLLVIAGACFLAYSVLAKQERPASQIQPPPAPTTVQSKLTGLKVAPEVNDRQVTGVMIENSLDARPQAGLKDAGFVFEAIAEGGITRFLALYQDTDSTYIGPVRSVRPYYLDIVSSFDAAIAHVGGSPEALNKLQSLKLKDLDQFQNPGAYDRVNSKIAPHNVYTSSAKLQATQKKKGFKKSSYTGFEHLQKGKTADKVTARIIKLNLSGALYNVAYTYHPPSNSYRRAVGGAAHKDEKSGKTLSPNVVIAVETTRSQSGQYSVYKMTGKGKVKIFQNGTVTNGTWSRTGAKGQYIFKDANDAVIKLVPGQAWMTLVTAGGATHAP